MRSREPANSIDAPSSTKNAAGPRDPGMSSTKTGTDWFFGSEDWFLGSEVESALQRRSRPFGLADTSKPRVPTREVRRQNDRDPQAAKPKR